MVLAMKIRFWLKGLLNLSLLGLFSLLTYLSWSSKSQDLIQKAARSFKLANDSHDSLNLNKIGIVPEQLFERRTKLVETLCQDVNISAIVSPRNLLYSKRLKVLYCPLTHTASTAVKYAMLKAEDIPIRSHKLYQLQLEQGIHSDAQKLGIRTDVSKLSSSMDTLLIVRDPWQRLISSYEELLHDGNRKRDLQWCMDLLRLDNSTLLSFNAYLDCVVAMRIRHKYYLESITSACSLCKVKYNKIGK